MTQIKTLILILLFGFIAVLSCKKTIELEPVYVANIDGTFNGQPWGVKNNWVEGGYFVEGSSKLRKFILDTTISCKIDVNRLNFKLGMAEKDEKFDLLYTREDFTIIGVSKKIKKYGIISSLDASCDIKDSVKVSFATLAEDGDVLKDYFGFVDASYANFFELTDYDSLQFKAAGNFDIKFINKRRSPSSTYPDTVHLKGSFSIKRAN